MGLLLDQEKTFTARTGCTRLQGYQEIRRALERQQPADDLQLAFKGIASTYIAHIIRAEEAKGELLQSISRLAETEKAPLRSLVGTSDRESTATDQQIVDNCFRLVMDPAHIHRFDRGASAALGNAEFSRDIDMPGFLAGALKGLNRVFGNLPPRLDAQFVEALHDDTVRGASRSVPVVRNEPCAPGFRDRAVAAVALTRGQDLTQAGSLELARLNPSFSYLIDVSCNPAGNVAHGMLMVQPVSSLKIQARVTDFLKQHRKYTRSVRLPTQELQARQRHADAVLCSSVARLQPFSDANTLTAHLLMYAVQRQRGDSLSRINPANFVGHSTQELASAMRIHKMRAPLAQALTTTPASISEVQESTLLA